MRFGIRQEAAEDNTEDDGEEIPAAAKSQEDREVPTPYTLP